VPVDKKPSPQFLTTKEAAAILGVRPNTMAQWRCAGYGPPWYRVGPLVRYVAEEITDWVKAQEGMPRNSGGGTPLKRQAGKVLRGKAAEMIAMQRKAQNHS
jgi:hypothetical protein